jgi:glycerophosphoryl diester phosphodiesterase
MSGKPDWPRLGTCVAHRGACGTAPENTTIACLAAIEQGARTIEVDVQRCGDGELVVAHDSKLRRTTDIAQALPDRADATVNELTMAELRKLDAGAWFDERYRGEPVPTLAELLAAIDGRSTLFVELKRPECSPGIEEQLAEELRRCLGDRLDDTHRPAVAIQVVDVDRLWRLHELLPTVPMCLMSGLTYMLEPARFAELGDWVCGYTPLGRLLTAEHVTAAHEHGIRVLPWTIDAPEAVTAMRDLGVDSVITNNVPFAQPILSGQPSRLPRTPVRIESASVADERVVLRAESTVDLTGWSLRNHLLRRQQLPARKLAAGDTLQVSSASRKFLDNYGDTLALYDADDVVVDLHFYREWGPAAPR